MNPVLSQTFTYLRFPLAVLVIYLHIVPMPTVCTLDFNWLQQDGSSLYYVFAIAIFKIAAVAVPCFFMMSGYLLFVNVSHLSIKIYKEKIKRRVSTLLIPYVIWNLLAVAYLFLTQSIILDTWKEIFIAPANFPLWFVRDLIIMIVISPIFYWIIKYLKYAGICIITLFFLGGVDIPIGWLATSSLYFFYIGCFLGKNKVTIINISTQIKYCCYGITLALFITLFVFNGTYIPIIQRSYLLTATFSVIFFASNLIDKKRVNIIPLLSISSFFIYTIHRLGITYISKLFFFFLPVPNYYTDTIKLLICPLITASLCVVIYRILQNICPQVLFILTGHKKK